MTTVRRAWDCPPYHHPPAKALYTRQPTEDEMKASGFAPEDYEQDVVEVWPENWATVQFFSRLSTQWRHGMGGPTGLDYASVLALLRAQRLPRAQADEIFGGVQIMGELGLF